MVGLVCFVVMASVLFGWLLLVEPFILFAFTFWLNASRFCLTAGFPVQNAFCVRPFSHQRRHSGDWNSGRDQELPGREVHPPCPNEGW